MRKALLIAALLGIVGVSGLAAGSSGSLPKLRIVTAPPLQVAGTGFKPGEQVKIVLFVSPKKWMKEMRAGISGRFVVTFSRPFVDRCSTFTVNARGDLGSRASVRSRPRADCPEPDYP